MLDAQAGKPWLEQKEWPHPGGSTYLGKSGCIGGAEALKCHMYQFDRFYSDEAETWFDRDPVGHNAVAYFKDGYTKDIGWDESLRPASNFKHGVEIEFKDGAHVAKSL